VIALPLILAGPILRRVEPRLVSVWMAFSEAQTDISLRLWHGRPSGKNEPLFSTDAAQLSATSPISTKRIGTHLHIALVVLEIVVPELPLTPGETYSYNLTFGGSDLKKEGLLKSTEESVKRRILALGYSDDKLPSFRLAPDNFEEINIAHGSCRKLHGVGRDGLAALDKLIKDSLDEASPISTRPHQLYMTGDQIYADDVPIIGLIRIAALGAELFGNTQELIQLKAGVFIPSSLAAFPPQIRKHIITDTGGLSSDDAASHLISFREFCSLYLLSWNNLLWEDTFFDLKKNMLPAMIDQLFLPVTQAIDNVSAITKPLLFDKALTDQFSTVEKKNAWIADHKEVLKKQAASMIDFRDGLPAVRRVLANVPTYMIFDDHEITDDWYLSGEWRQRVFSKPMGVDIVRNGLMAYTLFQAWGNDPLAFTPTGTTQAEINQRKAKSDLLGKITELFPDDASGPSAPQTEAIGKLLGLDGAAPPVDPNAPDQPVTWHYQVPAGVTTVYVLDTRTRRTYDNGLRAAPALLSDAALEQQISRTLPASATEKCIIIVSPAPVLGLSLFEELIQPTGAAAGLNYSFDFEAWGVNPAGLEAFLARIAPLKSVVLLSGDVHYGFTATMSYWKNGMASRIVQCTSSAFKNGMLGNQRLLVSGSAQRVVDDGLNLLFGGQSVPAIRYGWEHLPLTPSGVVAPRHLMRLHREPVLLSPHGWIPGVQLNRKSEWQWQMELVVDDRHDVELPQKVRILDISPDFSIADARSGYNKMIDRHLKIFTIGMGRRIVYASNIGIVNFLTQEGHLNVRQRFYFQLRDDNEDDAVPRDYVVHITPIDPPLTTGNPPELS
jgi:hypothetical protein